MNKAIRMLEIMQLLRGNRQPKRAEDIAESLGVSKRTIYRDIAALQAMAVPIDGEAGVGYVMQEGFHLPPMRFSPDEVEAIIVGLALLKRTADKGLLRAAESVSSKIGSVVSGASPEQFAIPAVAASGWTAIPESQVDPTALRKAIREGRALDIDYRSLAGAETTRTVVPVAMLYHVDAILLAAWCELRKDFRHFRVDLIQRCAFTGRADPVAAVRLRIKWQQEHAMA